MSIFRQKKYIEIQVDKILENAPIHYYVGKKSMRIYLIYVFKKCNVLIAFCIYFPLIYLLK